MAIEQFVNDVQSTLAAGISDSDLSLTVASATGFPSSGNFRIRIDNEILTATAVAGTTFTVSRATEAVSGVTAAAAHSSGAAVHQVLTAGGLDAFALLAGRSGGQTVNGGTAASEKLILNSTAHATLGLVQFGSSTNKACFDEVNGNLIVGALATDSSQSSSSPRKFTAYGSRNNASFRCHTNETGTNISAVFELGNSNGGNFTQMAKLQDIDDIVTLDNVTGNRINLAIGGTTRVQVRAAYFQEDVTNSNTTTAATVHYFDHNSSGTPAAGFGSKLVWRIGSSTTTYTQAAYVTVTWGVATHASREGVLSLYATDYGGDRLGFQVTGNGSATEIGFYGVTPTVRPSAYTQTYSTADKTHANPTAAALTVADGAGTNDGTIGAITADASVIAAVQELADQVNKLIADVADVKQVVNSVIDDLQSLGLLQ